LSEVLKLRRNNTRSVLRVNLSQAHKLRRNNAFAYRAIVERSKKLRNPLRFHNRHNSGGTTSLEYRWEPRIHDSKQNQRARILKLCKYSKGKEEA
jgi:plasmid replication initiation protein